jgi:opine dehydrogenase
VTTVAVLGAGSGGLATAVELIRAGHAVRLWNRAATTLEPCVRQGGVRYTGVLGEGAVRPESMTTVLAEALAGADVVVVALPSLVHARLFADLVSIGWTGPVVLNPGHTGGALHLRAHYLAAGLPVPPTVEFSTLTYVARNSDGCVAITGRAGTVRAGALPGGQVALDLACGLFPSASPVPDVLASSLSNVNVVLHPPGAVLAAAWVEATGGDFTFYVQGMTPAVGRVMAALDAERLSIARAFGHELPPLAQEMAAIGTVGTDAVGLPLEDAVRGGAANARIMAPESLEHRYYREDLPYGLVPLLALADLARVPAPTAEALARLGGTAMGEDPFEVGLSLRRLGLEGLTSEGLRFVVRGKP